MKIIIIGPGASGKNYFAQKFIDKGFKLSVMYTTRPIRDNETQNKEYIFLSNKSEFEAMVEQNQFIEYTSFNDWYYGTTYQSWNDCNLFLLSPAGLRQIKEKISLENFMIFYLNPNKELIRSRLMQRNDADNALRRYNADLIDFQDFTEYDVMITDFS